MLAGKNDLCFVSKVDLNDFVAESEHDGMFGFHPFLDIAVSTVGGGIFVEINFVVGVEIISEMLEKCDFFLKLSFRRIVTDFVGSDGVSFVSSFFLDIFKIVSIFVDDDFGGIIEIDSC